MAQFDKPLMESAEKHATNVAHLFASTLSNTSNIEFNMAKSTFDKPIPGLPNLELFGLEHDKSPWDKPAASHTRWEALKQAFGFGETVGDKVRDDVVKGLTKEQQEKYKDEEAAQRNYEASATIMNFPRPASPIHDLVDKKVKETEDQIVRTVRAHMTPAERAELDKELKDMDRQYEDWKKHFNPLGTGDLGPRIKPGPAVVKYFRQVEREATEKD